MSIVYWCLVAMLAVPVSAAKYLNRGNGAEPKGLDPHQASGDPENQILGDMYVGLYTEDGKGDPILGAAEKVTTSADGLTWTFKLRDHKWSDGKPVTSADFVFAYRRILDPIIASEYANILFPIKNAEKVSKGVLTPEQPTAPRSHSAVGRWAALERMTGVVVSASTCAESGPWNTRYSIGPAPASVSSQNNGATGDSNVTPEAGSG